MYQFFSLNLMETPSETADKQMVVVQNWTNSLISGLSYTELLLLLGKLLDSAIGAVALVVHALLPVLAVELSNCDAFHRFLVQTRRIHTCVTSRSKWRRYDDVYRIRLGSNEADKNSERRKFYKTDVVPATRMMTSPLFSDCTFFVLKR